MSRTYKHQKMYDWKHYEDPTSKIVVKKRIKYYYWRPVENGLPEYVEENVYREIPGKKDVHQPDYTYSHASVEARRAKWYHQESTRKCRRQVKQLIHKGEYTEAEYLKPENVDWSIW